ncbi:hypothetical protein Tco_0728628 [Tanacetum coccineum]|uniref:Reverse transcriptase domain-containing protein n=1 Tax=Tanacetum coccineum TaxID=301880 RepID=A0ABQ4YPD2_9ASTR
MDDLNIIMEEYIRLEDEKARKHGRVFNWETAKYGKICYDEYIHDLRSVETEFPAIAFIDEVSSEKTLSCEPTVSSLNDENDFRVLFDDFDNEDYMNEFSVIVYNDAQTSKSDVLTEPILSPRHIDEFDLNDETSLSEYKEEEQNILYFNDLFPFNIIHFHDLKSEKDNDNNEIDIIQSSEGNEITHGSNVLSETSHDKINKTFRTGSFVMNLKVNIVIWTYCANGMLFYLIMNLCVPFGIPFDPKRYYKDGDYAAKLAGGKGGYNGGDGGDDVDGGVVMKKQLNLGVGTELMIFNIDYAMKHSYSNDDTCFSIDVIDEILKEDFDAHLDEGSKILHSIEGTLLEEEIFSEFDEFMAMTADENSESESDTEEPPFEKITINTDYKTKTSLEEPPTDLELKPLPDNLEYVFLEEPSFLPVIISSKLSAQNKSKLVSILKKHKEAFAWKTTDIPGICPSFSKHKIQLLDDKKPVVQKQKRLNPNMQEVVKK